MTAIPLYFELPENLTAKKILAKLSKKLTIQIISQQYTIKTYYDSFDWRLYNAGMICEFNHSQKASQISLIDRKTNDVLALESIQNVPNFCEQFPVGHLKAYLAEPMEMRALLPLCQLPHEVYRFNVLNKDQKTILRIQLDEHELVSNRLYLQPLKGYGKAVKNVSGIIQKAFNLKPTERFSLKEALKVHGRKPKDYQSKLAIKLLPEIRADKASKLIYRQLLKAIKSNEAGTIADIDTEFLHDFRVAVRRTRSGLSQLKNTLPVVEVAQYTGLFAWLGQITSLTRDMDVYLLNYKKYKAALPISLREDLMPLYDFLKVKQTCAQKELAEKLSSSEYTKQLVKWEQFLKEPLPKKGQKGFTQLTVKELADHRIWKVYKRILKEGKDITDSSPAEALHNLRKTCKKLRYLIEFFQSLYPEKDIKTILKALKGFQSVLGDFQDYEVQEISIKQFSEEMMKNNVSPNTFLAMGVLVQYLDSMKCVARSEFSGQFGLFEQESNQRIFKNLFAYKPSVKK